MPIAPIGLRQSRQGRSKEPNGNRYANPRLEDISEGRSNGGGLLWSAQWRRGQERADRIADIMSRFWPERKSRHRRKKLFTDFPEAKENPAQFCSTKLFREERPLFQGAFRMTSGAFQGLYRRRKRCRCSRQTANREQLSTPLPKGAQRGKSAHDTGPFALQPSRSVGPRRSKTKTEGRFREKASLRPWTCHAAPSSAASGAGVGEIPWPRLSRALGVPNAHFCKAACCWLRSIFSLKTFRPSGRLLDFADSMFAVRGTPPSSTQTRKKNYRRRKTEGFPPLDLGWSCWHA